MEVIRVGPFVEYLDRVHQRTRRIVDVVREEDLEWQAGPGRLTPGELIRHLAGIERYMYARERTRPTSALPGTRSRDRRGPCGDKVVLRSLARRSARAIRRIVRRSAYREMPDARRRADHSWKVATRHDRARGAPPRAALLHSRASRSSDSTYLWIDLRGSARSICILTAGDPDASAASGGPARLT